MAELIELCTDLISESEKSDNPILLDSLTGLKNHRILKQTEDETLKALLKCINQMLNEPRTRTKGLMLLDNFLSQVEATRYIGFQDSFQSTLNLLTKCLDQDLTHRILVHVLPLCQKLPELNQAVISAVIPKLLSRFCEKSKTTLPTHEEVSSILVCLERYRGPCGQYRFQIEKFLIPLVDSISVDDEEVFKQFSKLLPLLSASGGGGNKGDKYSQDWYEIIMKLLENIHNCVVFLYSDVCPYIATENPYILAASDSQNQHVNLNLEKIRHPNVLMRISLTYRRLFNLTKLLSDFLIEPFPAPKQVPIRGILQLITNMMIINPVNILKNSSAINENESVIPKENIHLAALLPSIHKCALDVLNKLILSCDVQLFPEGARLELLILQQLKWIVEHQGSFEVLKCQLYATVESWLTITNSSITSNKNATLLVQEIIQDIKIERHNVSLLLSHSRGKKGNKQSHKKQQTVNLVTASKNVSTKEAEVKSERVCSAALKCLQLLIPSLDFASYRAIYIILATTIGDFIQSAEQFPSPYDSAECRTQAFKTLTQLILNPHPKSPISIGLTNSLLELGSRDPDRVVSSECHNCLSMVERIIHPSYGTLQFPQVNIPLTTTPFSVDQLQNKSRDVEEEEEEQQQINEEEEEKDKNSDDNDDESMAVDDEVEANSNKSSHRKNINSSNNSFYQSETLEEDDEEEEDGKIVADDEERPSSSSFLNMSTRSTASLVDTSLIKDCVAQALKESLSELGLTVGTRQQINNYSSSNNYSNGPASPLLDNDDSLNGYDDGDESTIFTDSGSDRLIRINRIVSTPIENGNMDHLALVKDIEKSESLKKNNKSSKRFNNSDSIEPPMKKVKTWKTGLPNGNGNHDEDDDDDEDDDGGEEGTKKSKEDDVSVTVQEILLDFDDNIVFQE